MPNRVLVLAFSYKPLPRVVEYVNHLAAHGTEVDLLVADGPRWRGAGVDLRVRVHPPRVADGSTPLRRVERLLLFRIPGGLLARAGRLAARSGLGRPVRLPIATLERGHQRLANAFHRRIFMPLSRIMRPRVMVRQFRRKLRSIELGGIDRIVAADIYAVTLGYKLARRCPDAVATTSLLLPGPG